MAFFKKLRTRLLGGSVHLCRRRIGKDGYIASRLADAQSQVQYWIIQEINYSNYEFERECYRKMREIALRKCRWYARRNRVGEA